MIGGLGRAPGKIRMKSIGTSKTVVFQKDDVYRGGYGGVGWVVSHPPFENPNK